MKATAAVSGIAVPLAALALVAPGAADGGRDDDVRVREACLGGTGELRLRAEEGDGGGEGTIEIEARIDVPERVRAWRVVVLHERTLVQKWTRRSSSSLRVRSTVSDWPGSEAVTVRVATGAGRMCSLEATI